MKILECDCNNGYQDRLHGRGKRLFNRGKAKNGKVPFYCTCCGRKIGFRQMIRIDFESGRIETIGLMHP